MTGLKTLSLMNYHSGCHAGTELYVSKEAIKKEAIKHIKSILEEMSPNPINCDHCTDLRHTTEWIKHFFNITEEDLK